MKSYLQWGLACLALAGLASCSSASPENSHPVYGTVWRIIGAGEDQAALEPCLASRFAQLQAGSKFAAIRYRHWASHFVTTVFAEIPEGMELRKGTRLEIVPGECGKNELASIVRQIGD
ncbi:hypothetical protein [Herbaspirillum sp.]|uniref:hypothetical protein n=1 Tax=Herbaspirillum sp. TaxID=1890675 RepID=UPI0031E0278F